MEVSFLNIYGGSNGGVQVKRIRAIILPTVNDYRMFISTRKSCYLVLGVPFLFLLITLEKTAFRCEAKVIKNKKSKVKPT